MNQGLPTHLRPITNRFSINQKKEFGKGCFGKVYEGYDHDNGRIIAIKHLNRPENFKDEIQTLEKLSTLTHPYIMGFYGYKADKDDVYLFIQYCPGGVLTDLISKGLDQEQVLNLFRQLVEGMCYMNAKGIMHRDLKPDNILIGKNNDIKISDFGLAKVQDGLEKTTQTGTPLYAGPQIYVNYTDAYNLNCDVWSAGLILHEMLTKKHPFEHIKTIYDLKAEWQLFQKGQRRISYPKQLHQQWQYLTNILLTYNFKKRPMFHDILELLKKLDDNGTMRKQIRNAKRGIKIEENVVQSEAQSYLGFIEQKCEIILSLINDLKQENYPLIKESLQELIRFLLTAWYSLKIKNLIRSLKFKNIKYPNKKDVLDNKNPDDKILFVLEKYKNIFETKYTQSQILLKEKIFKNLTHFATKPEDLNLFKSVDSAFKLFQEAKDGTFDTQQTYQEQYIKILNFYKLKPTEQRIGSMTLKQHKIYAKMLIVGFMKSEIDESMYYKRNYVNERFESLLSQNPSELKQYILKLRNKLK